MCNRFLTQILCASILVICPIAPIFASVQSGYASQHFDDSNEYISEMPVVLSAIRILQPIAASPVSVTVLNRNMIEASGAQEIGDLLRLVPGFQVGYFNGISMSLTYHGFTGNYDRRLQVLVDGRSVYMPMLSTVEWLSLPLDISEIEKVEVVRGSNTPAYGSNSFQGVINIITRKSFQDLGAKISLTGGSNNLNKFQDAVGNKALRHAFDEVDSRKALVQYADVYDDLEYRFTVGYQRDHGFDEVRDSKTLSLGNLVLSYQFDTHNMFDVQLGFRVGTMDTFASGDQYDPFREKSIQSHHQSVTWRRVVSQSHDLEFRFYHNYFKQNDEFTFGTVSEFFGEPPPELVPENLRPYLNENISQGIYFGSAERFDAEMQYTFRLSTKLRMVSGGGVRLDRIKSLHLLNDKGFVSDKSARLYSNLEWYLMNYAVINAGIMLERNQQVGFYYSPRFAINFFLNRQNVVRLAFTRAMRTPSILENHLDLAYRLPEQTRQPLVRLHFSEKNLEAEKLDTLELGYLYHARDQKLSFDSKVFVEKIRDGILEAKDHNDANEAWAWGNNTSAEIYGVETQLILRPVRKFWVMLSHAYLNANVRWIHDINLAGADEESRDISNSVPDHTISALLSYELHSELSWSISYYAMSYMHWLQDGSKLHAYDRIDSRIAWTHPISPEQRLNLALVVQNLGNAYREVQYQTVFQRRAFISLTFEW